MLEVFFDDDKPIMRALSVAADLLILNLLTAICMGTVIAAGAAVTALYHMTYQIVRKESGYIVRGYFASVKRNFVPGLLMGLLSAVCMLAVAFNLWGIRHFAGGSRLLIVLTMVAAIAAYTVFLYAFILLARYDNGIGKTLANAFLLSVGYFPRTVLMLFVHALWFGVLLRFGNILFPVALMFGLSLPAYMCAFVYDGIFQKLEDEK